MKHFKKIISLTLAMTLIAFLGGCGKESNKETTTATTTEVTSEDISTETSEETSENTSSDALTSIIEDSKNTIGQGNYPEPLDMREIDMSNTDDMMYILGTESLQGLQKGVVAEPMMSSVAFSLVALEFDSADNASAAATSLQTTAPTQKWLCVMPEAVMTKVVNDNYVLFFMGPQASADALK